MQKKFTVTGMSCSACAAAVERSVKKIDGVQSVNVNLLAQSMIVDFDANVTNVAAIIQAVEQAGYGAYEQVTMSAASQKEDSQPVNPAAQEALELKHRLIVSFVFLIPLMYIAMGHMLHLPLPRWLDGTENAVTFAFLQFLLTLPIVYVNRKYYQAGFKSLRKRNPNMDSLIAIGSAAAILYGIIAIFRIGYGLGHHEHAIVHQYMMDLYFETGAMILTLITLGKFLEARSKGRTSQAIAKLLDLAPNRAVVIRNEQEMEVPVEEIVVGDVVVIRPGQKIPVDGVIIEGSCIIDQSALTGESIPIEKTVGDRVISATINKSGFIKFKAEKVGNETTLAQIVQLVEAAATSKAPIARLADRISGIFVPVVMIIAAAAAGIWLLLGAAPEFALSVGIAVLVISCPCALGLATPVAIMVGTGQGALHGILIKSAEALEIAHTVDTVVLDKTGTITEGKPRVTDVITAPGVIENELLTIAASIEKPSEHPLAEALMEKAHSLELALKPTSDFSAITGKGIVATIDGVQYIAGNVAMMEEFAIPTADWQQHLDALAEAGKTPLLFASQERVLGIVAVADVIKPTSQAAIDEFKAMGIDVVMLTGDNRKTAEAIRKQLGLNQVIAEVMPQDKESTIRALQAQGKRVAMIGDGINDAPALVRADVGIAIGAGTDIAIESADVVLMRNDLLDAVAAIQLSKATLRNIKQNLFWAFFYNSLGIPLAAGVFYTLLGWKLSPMIGAATMSLSSVFVVTNALRLKMFQPKFRESKE